MTAFISYVPALPPPLYLTFIADMRRMAEEKGLAWEVPLDDEGLPLYGQDWDLRCLNGSHQRDRAGTCGFAVEDVRALAQDAGWPEATLPQGGVLSRDAQEFLKAAMVSKCLAGKTADTAQTFIKACRRLLSLTTRKPWEVRAEDFEKLASLKDWSAKGLRDFSSVGRFIDERLLSVHSPVRLVYEKQKSPTMLGKLTDRAAGDKLPERSALLELTRIVFQETPTTCNDLVWFLVVRLATLTGLRIEEVTHLPLNCLVWEEHVDVVTGRSAGDVGGVDKSLRIHYFAEKHRDGAPDVLVDAWQWVPRRFEQAVVEAINLAEASSEHARALLLMQGRNAAAYPGSDTRQFTTTTGTGLATADMLFLAVGKEVKYPLAGPLPRNSRIGVARVRNLYHRVSTRPAGPLSFFKRYGTATGASEMFVLPHSLRHLMNTELFRLDVPDTAITHQFGRKTVAQSHEYDHRSLAEKLRFVALPPAAVGLIRPGSPQEIVAKMVVSGTAGKSHIAESFRKIQAEHGDEAAFQYLAANSDGFHVTPYGFCTNSFSLNPCARHLKCFDGCKHFAASGVQEHRISLESLKEKLLQMRSSAERKPATSVGRRNQISHAERLVAGVTAALEAHAGACVFPTGVDYASPPKDIFK